jgi:voltage-gated potassium channel
MLAPRVGSLRIAHGHPTLTPALPELRPSRPAGGTLHHAWACALPESLSPVSPQLRRLALGLLVFLAICCIAAAGYIQAGWEPMDAIYMVVITVFGVGFGEVNPVESTALRVMTILLIVCGYAAAIYIMGGFVQMITEGEINRALHRRRVTKGIEQLSGHAIVCGLGRIGRILAAELAKEGMPFVLIDQDDAKLSEIEAEGGLVINGNAIEEDVLLAAGIGRARVLATVLPDDAANVFITLTAHDLNPTLEIIARGENPSTEKKLLRSGASHVILPHVIGGIRMAQLITRPSTEKVLASMVGNLDLQSEFTQIGLRLDELPIAAGSELDGGTIGDIVLQGNHGFLIVSVRRADGSVVIDPPTDCDLTAGDTVIVLGHIGDLPQLAKRYLRKREMMYRGSKG